MSSGLMAVWALSPIRSTVVMLHGPLSQVNVTKSAKGSGTLMTSLYKEYAQSWDTCVLVLTFFWLNQQRVACRQKGRMWAGF